MAEAAAMAAPATTEPTPEAGLPERAAAVEITRTPAGPVEETGPDQPGTPEAMAAIVAEAAQETVIATREETARGMAAATAVETKAGTGTAVAMARGMAAAMENGHGNAGGNGGGNGGAKVKKAKG